MRSTLVIAVAFIALVACRDGPTAPPPADSPVASSVAQRAVVATNRLDVVSEELRGPFVQALVRSHLDPALADELRDVLPSRASEPSEDQLSAAEAFVRKMAARVGQAAPAAPSRASHVTRSSVAEAAIARDVLQLILDDATQMIAFERARLQSTRELHAVTNNPHE